MQEQEETLEETTVPLRMINLLKQRRRNKGVVHVQSNLHWLIPTPNNYRSCIQTTTGKDNGGISDSFWISACGGNYANV